MPYFDRFDICGAYLAMEWDWNVSGVLQERKSNARRRMSTEFQLHRMRYKHGAMWDGCKSLSENGREIYAPLCQRYGFRAPCPDCFGTQLIVRGRGAALCPTCGGSGEAKG
jgi:hypothetical protein